MTKFIKEFFNLWKVGEINPPQISDNGIVRLGHDCTISLESYITKSLKDTIISRVEGISPKNDIIIDPSDCKAVDVNISLTTPLRCASFLSEIETSNQTVVIFTNKKHCTDLFVKNDLLSEAFTYRYLNGNTEMEYQVKGTVSSLMEISTLNAIYKKIENSWITINKNDETDLTNVMFIPDIYVFYDDKTNELLSHPYTINLLVVALPKLSKISEESDVNDGIRYSIENTFDAAIRCGCKNLIIDPFSYKMFTRDISYTASLWYDFISRQNVIEGIDKIDFTLLDSNLYKLFYSSNPLK